MSAMLRICGASSLLAPQMILTQCPSSSALAGDAARSRGARRGMSLCFQKRTEGSADRALLRGGRVPRHAADPAPAGTQTDFWFATGLHLQQQRGAKRPGRSSDSPHAGGPRRARALLLPAS